MKKILSTICLLLMPIILLGCGNKNSEKEVKADQQVEETNTSQEKETSATQSDDLYSFQITLNGKLYTLPADYSEFEQNGWNYKGVDSDKKVAPNQYTIGDAMKNGDMQVYAQLVNTGKDELSLKECKVGKIQVCSLDTKKGVTIGLPKGINFDSTKDDIIKAYGNPTRTDERDTMTNMTYEIGDYQSVKITFDNKLGKVYEFDVQNFTEKSAVSSKKSSSSDASGSATGYNAPTELTDDLFSFNIKYDGVLYHMAPPLSEMEKNGWEIQNAPKDDVASRDFSSGVILRKGNQTLRTSIYNNSSKATSAENCVVTDIISDDYTTQVPLELPKGIKVGSSKADVEAAYSGLKLESGDSTSLEFYTYSKTSDQKVDIIVNKDSQKVSKITVRYTPGKDEMK